MRSFLGEVHIVQVEKKKGMEDVRLLYNEEEEEEGTTAQGTQGQGSVWDTLSRYSYHAKS